MSAFATPQKSKRPPQISPLALSPTRVPLSQFERRLPLRPARIVFPDGSDGKNAPPEATGMPIGLHTWRGRVELSPHEGWVLVTLSEIPSGRSVEIELSEGWFTEAKISPESGLPIELRVWQEIHPEGIVERHVLAALPTIAG